MAFQTVKISKGETADESAAMDIMAKEFVKCMLSGGNQDACGVKAKKAAEAAGFYYDKNEGQWMKGEKKSPSNRIKSVKYANVDMGRK